MEMVTPFWMKKIGVGYRSKMQKALLSKGLIGTCNLRFERRLMKPSLTSLTSKFLRLTSV